ncbi:MAG: Mur ligase domain-containing protein, partial [Kiritimatiellia bacterium]
MSQSSPNLVSLLSGVPGQAHLMGVCGVGVAGVARLLQARGWQVSGCDASPDGAMARWLQAQGIAVLAKHDASHVGCGGSGGPALPDQAGEGQVGRG